MMRETFHQVREIICKQINGIAAAQVVREADLVRDLGADSLDMMNMLCDLEDVFDVEIPEEESAKIRTVGDAVELMERLQTK